MEVRLAIGDGIKGGTRETERDTSMDKIRPRGKWANKELNDVKCLVEHNFSTSKIGKIFGATKNAVIGALYRDKIRNGYVPPEDSKYTGPKGL
tara:strand:+ start:518 stop:796 length:279 start_codon:yes stop_codon:yes gene_type:complete